MTAASCTSCRLSVAEIVDARSQSLRKVIERIGVVTRDFAATGTYPFKARGLTRAQINLLFVVSRSDAIGVAQLARQLAVTSGAVSQTVEALRVLDLLTSEVNPRDRRGRVIRLTEGARIEVEYFERAYYEAIAPRFDELTLDDIVTLDRILSSLEKEPQ